MGDIIRLLDSVGGKVVDSVACDYEDSFSLETFGDLCEMHRMTEPKNKKSLIIARVQTWDPKQPEKAFYSYYNAFQLNKILFQTQNYLGKRFIHRLHVLNPLTNSDIIGNVKYYMVKNREGEKDMAIEIPLIQDSSKNDAATESKTSVMEVSIPVESNITDSTDIYVEPVFPSQNPRKTSLRLLIDSNSLLASEFKNNPEYTLNSPMIMEDDEEYEAAWTMGNHTVAEAPDISIPKVSSGRRESAIQLGFNKSVLFMRRSNPFIGPPNAIGIQKKGGQESLQKRSMSLTVSKVEDIIPSGINNRRRTEFTIPITSLLPSGPVHVHRPTRVQAPPGIITRFTVPVPKDDLAKIVPKTYRGHRRSLSYQNAVSASGTPASFEEWVRMVHQEKGQIKDREMSETGDEYDVVKPFSQTPKTPTRMGGRDFKLATIVDETAIQVNSPEGVPDGNMKLLNSDGLPRENFKTSKMMNDDKEDQDLDLDIIIYDAFLIATDNDFLESSKIRALFRENAIVPDDAKLFEMPAYTGEQQSSPTVEIVEDSLLCEWCYPSSQVLSQTTPCIRAFHRAKCYIFAALLVSIAVAFILIIVLQGNRVARVSA